MASLRKDPRGKSPFWYACITIPGRGQTQRSTGIKASERTRAEAMVIAERLERQAKQLGPAAHLKNRDAVLEAFVAATQKAVAGELTEACAREVLDRILESAGQGVLHSESVRTFAEGWLKARSIEIAPATLISYTRSLRLFVEHLGAQADKPLNAVMTRQVESFKASRVAAGLSARTVDINLEIVRSMFRTGLTQGHLRYDPTQGVRLISKTSKAATQTITREIFQEAELDPLVSAATGEWLTVLLLGRYTGARLNDCALMCWNNVDLDASVIRYSDQKTGKSYAVPIHRRLQEHLISLAGTDDPRELLSPALAKLGTKGVSGLSMQFIRFMESAGVDPMKVPTKALHKVEGKRERIFARRSFHSLRYTYNTLLANADVPQEIRRKLVGHSSNDVNDVYTHLDLKLFRGAIDKLA